MNPRRYFQNMRRSIAASIYRYISIYVGYKITICFRINGITNSCLSTIGGRSNRCRCRGPETSGNSGDRWIDQLNAVDPGSGAVTLFAGRAPHGAVPALNGLHAGCYRHSAFSISPNSLQSTYRVVSPFFLLAW